MPIDTAMAYLIINNSFILAGGILAMIRTSNCSKFLCARCIEIDNVSHQETTLHQQPTNEIITTQSQIVQPQNIQVTHIQ